MHLVFNISKSFGDRVSDVMEHLQEILCSESDGHVTDDVGVNCKPIRNHSSSERRCKVAADYCWNGEVILCNIFTLGQF